MWDYESLKNKKLGKNEKIKLKIGQVIIYYLMELWSMNLNILINKKISKMDFYDENDIIDILE